MGSAGHDPLPPALEGGDERPAVIGDGLGYQTRTNVLQTVDTQNWTTKSVRRASGCEPLRAVYVCTTGEITGTNGSSPATIGAYTHAWKLLWERHIPSFRIVDGHLLASNLYASEMWALDPRTGRTLKKSPEPFIGPSALRPWRTR